MLDETYRQIKISIKRLLNIDLDAYKEEQMRRRLDSWLVRIGAASWDEYFKRLNNDAGELEKFRNYLTINVSEFFRDFERWQTLRQQIMPDLLKAAQSIRPGRGGLRVWSAGCSIGPEPYTLAILLDEIAPHQTHYLLASDLDRGALQKARNRGPYTVDEVRNVSPVQKTNNFDIIGNAYYLKEKIAKKVTFREQNLLMDTFEKDFDLIVCRNVIIYFTNEAKGLLYPKFQGALRLGGCLFLGGTEIIPRPQDIGLKSHGISSFYIKV